MANFDKYAPTLKRWEGGFVNDPDDRGGATNMGITLATFRMYYGSSRTVADLKNISYEQWKSIMIKYWNRCQGDRIENQSIAEILVDWHINAGLRAITRTQSALGLKADGIIGAKSLAVLNGDKKMVFDTIKAARIQYYRNIVAANPSQAKFLNGWLNRVNSFNFQA